MKIAATRFLTDEKGEPLVWEVRPLNTKEDAAIRDACTIDVPVTGKPNMTKPKFLSDKYLAKVAAACVVYPNLNDKELQDSYGVMGAEQLITEMIDEPGEFNEFMNQVQAYQGFNQTFQDKVKEAKN